MKCELCGNDFNHLGLHLNYRHKDITQKEYYDRYLKRDGEGFCYTCGKPLPFISLSKGYKHYCDSKCELADKRVVEKAKRTYRDKTGYDHNMHNPESKERVKNTTVEKYGAIGFAVKELADRVLETYNKEHNTNITKCNMIVHENKELEHQRIETRIKNNNGSYNSIEHTEKLKELTRDPEIIKKRINARYTLYGQKYMTPEAYEKLKERYNSLHTYQDVNMLEYNAQGEGLCRCHCDKCGNDYEISLMTLRTRRYMKQEPCTVCNPIGSFIFKPVSSEENELYEYIASRYRGEIVRNDRTILNGQEIDIYLPELNLAFEFDGLYWHNEVSKPAKYHLNKTNGCEAKGIQLIHIFEDDWNYKTDIVKSRINNLLSLNDVIFARKCDIREVSYAESELFLNGNHIQGNCMSTYRYGLYYNDELVSLMTFGKSRFADEFELLRFCNRLNTNVVGGASRLFKHFIRNNPQIKKITSYADRCWSRGSLYEHLGFERVSVTAPSYYYVVDNMRRNRINFQKHKLVKEGFDPDKSEHEIMLERKIYRIYDCGTLKYVFTFPPVE